MADVKIVDIDSVQWNIKDQEARNKIIEIETKTNINEKILDQKGNSFISLITINGEKFINIHLDGNIIVSRIGQEIFKNGPVQGLTTVIRGDVKGVKNNLTGRIQFGLDVNPAGSTNAYPTIINQYDGDIEPCKLYGDCLIRVL